MKGTCLIIDDEPLAREVLENYISQVPGLELIASCKNAIEAIPVVKQQQPAIIFCDIKMPHLSGLDFLRLLDKQPAVIITTAHHEFAVEGFDIGVTDYLLKPVRFERFLKAVARAMGEQSVQLRPQMEDKEKKFLFFKTDGEFIKVMQKDISYIEAYGNYVRVHTRSKPLLVKDKISTIESLLDKTLFVRIHKSYIIPLQSIRKFHHNVVSLEKVDLPVGNFYKKEFIKAAGLE